MKLTRRNAKLAGVFLIILMLSITIPYQSVLAAIIGTEATLDSTRAEQARDEINSLLLREDVQDALMAYGVDPLEAKARIDSLSDAEAVRLADQIDNLPAGGAYQIIPAWVAILILVAVALLIYFIISGITPPTEVEKKSE
jgi:hypothetical protein